jgi:drug/metabolite transporter (DMT)-like permease
MNGILFGITASIGHGLGYILLKKSTNDFPASIAFLFDALWGIIIWIPFALITGIQTEGIGLVFLYALLSAILAEAFIFFVLSKGKLSITGTIFATYPIFTIIISRFVNNEMLSFEGVIFVGLTMIGVIVLSLPEKLKRTDLKNKSYVIYPLLGALAVGVSDSLSKNILNQTTHSTFLFCLSLTQIPVAIGYYLVDNQKISDLGKIFGNIKKYRYSISSSFLIVFSLIFFWLTFENAPASIASPLTATYPAFVVVFAWAFLGEQLVKKDIIGVLLSLVGIIGSSFVVS